MYLELVRRNIDSKKCGREKEGKGECVCCQNLAPFADVDTVPTLFRYLSFKEKNFSIPPSQMKGGRMAHISQFLVLVVISPSYISSCRKVIIVDPDHWLTRLDPDFCHCID